MSRVFAMTILTAAFTVAFLGAQGRPRPETKEDAPPDKKAPAKADADKKDLPAASSGEKAEEIIKRLNENFEKSEDRLGKKDPGEDTRKIQDKIVDDIDELIKQAQNNQNGGGGGGGGASSSGKSSGKSGKSGTKSASSGKGGGSSQNPSQGNKGGKDQNGKDQNKGGQDQSAKNKDGGGKDEKKDKGEGKGNEPKDKSAKAGGDKDGDGKGKDGKGGNGGGTNKDDPKKNVTADMIGRDIWGHLPLKQRLEMEAYAKQRFLPKYEDLLKQYYRTISESDRRKDD